MSKIEWTDKTLNPIAGCTRVSPACDNCYAVRGSYLRSFNPNPKIAEKYAGVATKDDSGNIVWTGKFNFMPSVMEAALLRKKPTRYFIGSMTDLFHEAVPDSFLDEIFSIMAKAKQHTFQILTKRPERMRKYMEGCERGAADLGGEFPWKNVWLGVTVENGAHERRIVDLLKTPATVRFISVEPMLGPVIPEAILVGCVNEGDGLDALRGVEYLGDATYNVPALDWVICGGETGPNARFISPIWVRSLRDQCVKAGVPFFFKKWGSYTGEGDYNIPAGHEIDGQVWEQFPEVRND